MLPLADGGAVLPRCGQLVPSMQVLYRALGQLVGILFRSNRHVCRTGAPNSHRQAPHADQSSVHRSRRPHHSDSESETLSWIRAKLTILQSSSAKSPIGDEEGT